MEVPVTFPNFKALGHYREPAISTVDRMHNLRCLRQGWDRPVDQRKLRNLLRDRFNTWTRGFLKHIAPIYLARALARATPEQRGENVRFGIVFKRTRKVKIVDGEEQPAKAERKIMFAPLPLVDINGSQRPLEEDWTIWDSKEGKSYDPAEPIECEMLDCFLRNGLSEDAMIVAPKPTRKKHKADHDLESLAPIEEPLASTHPFSRLQTTDPPQVLAAKKRPRTKKDARDGDTSGPARKKAKKHKTAEESDSPPLPVFKLPSSGVVSSRPLRPFQSAFPQSTVAVASGDLVYDTSENTYKAGAHQDTNSQVRSSPDRLAMAKALEAQRSIPRHEPPRRKEPQIILSAEKRKEPASTSLAALRKLPLLTEDIAETASVPGQVMDPAMLRRLRAAVFAKCITSDPAPLAICTSKATHEVIDLT